MLFIGVVAIVDLPQSIYLFFHVLFVLCLDLQIFGVLCSGTIQLGQVASH
jgi:hypothetical protein